MIVLLTSHLYCYKRILCHPFIVSLHVTFFFLFPYLLKKYFALVAFKIFFILLFLRNLIINMCISQHFLPIDFITHLRSVSLWFFIKFENFLVMIDSNIFYFISHLLQELQLYVFWTTWSCHSAHWPISIKKTKKSNFILYLLVQPGFAIYNFIFEMQKIISPTSIFCNYYIPLFNLGCHA